MATPRIAESVGRVLGDRYRLTRPLGVGASAHVYVAEDVHLRRRVAIKLLHPALAADEAFGRRFRAEARVVASLRHPNILRVYDWGYDGGAPYLVMELLEGGSLRALLDRGHHLTAAQAATVGSDAGRALDYAHRRGLVHRDIKPANLIFDDEGRVTVADFGLARALAEATWTEPAGAIVGTARYAAPEQVRGEALDSRADVYSLALVLIEAMTGTVPFATDTTLGTLMARLERPITSPPGVGPLAPVLDAAGTVDPRDRLDAGALARTLDDVAIRLAPPAPLPLTSSESAGEPEYDLSPTDYPGRPRLFDGAPYLPPPESPAPSSHPEAGPSRSVIAEQGEGRDGGAPGPPRPRRRRRRWLFAIMALAVLLGGAGAAAAVLASGAFTPSHPVPNLVGDSTATAEAALRPLHFGLAVTGHAYSDRPAGSIVGQRPAGGKLREGGVVAVTLSLGPRPVAVPRVATLTLQAATQALQAVHLKAVARYQSSMTVLAGIVISSNPDHGTLLPGQSVTVVVSTGKPKVAIPALSGPAGTSFPAAARALEAAGFLGHEVDEYSDTVLKGHIIATSPPAGTLTTVGSTVTVLVSRGPHLVAVPPVNGLSVGAASLRLSNLGFQVSGVSGNPVNTVIGTSPPVGTTLRYGAAVELITG